MGGGVSSWRVENGIGVLTIDSPPVNALGHAVRVALYEGVSRAMGDGSVEALLLICGGRTFFAGADVNEIGRPIQPPLLADVMAQFEASTKPIICAMHGTALGGGLEIALAAHFRVAIPSTVVGLPEVALGLLPGAGGTQRLPRLIGVEQAVEMIGLAKRVKAPDALRLGLIDAVVEEGKLEPQSIAFARKVLAKGARLRRVRDLSPNLGIDEARAVFDAFRTRHPELFIGVKAADGVLRAIEAAVTLSFEDGLRREREISAELIAGPESAAQRHLFFAARAAAKLPRAEKEKVPAIRSVAVSGDWRETEKLRAAGIQLAPSSDEIVIVADERDLEGFGAVVKALPEASTLVAVRHVEALDPLAKLIPSPASLVGLAIHRGVAEIVVGAQTGVKAALNASAIASKLGLPYIFVAPSPGLVVDRLRQKLDHTIRAMLADGVAAEDIAATGQAFGFRPELLPPTTDERRTDEKVEQRLVYPFLAEAIALLDEGIVQRASDLDFAIVRAGLFPLWRGGPLFHADRVGRDKVQEWAMSCEPENVEK